MASVKLNSRKVEREGSEFTIDLYEIGGSYRLFIDDEIVYESRVVIDDELFNVLSDVYVLGYVDGYGQGETDEYMRNN